MDAEATGVESAASPTATTPDATTASAGTVNTGTNGQATGAQQPTEKLTPFHLHPDWQRMVRDRDSARQENQQFRQAVTELQRRLEAFEQQARGPGLTPEQAREYVGAGDTLKQVIEHHPELKPLLDLAKNAQRLMQGYQGVGRITQSQQQAQAQAGRQAIEALAKAENLPGDKQALTHIEDLIAAQIGRDPDMLGRYRSGDVAVIRDAFEAIKPFLGGLRREAAASVIDTKNATRKLPPRPSGGTAGPSAPTKIDPKVDPRGFREAMHQRATARLGELQQG